MRALSLRFPGFFRLIAVSRALALCGATFVVSAGLVAQDDRDAATAAAPTQRSVRTSEAVALALSGRDSDAEATLATSLRHDAGSALGHLELASRLVRVAVECSANGKTEAADSFASRALEHLTASRRLATDRSEGIAASAWQLEGFVQLDFRGDRAAALAAYREAVALSPDNELLRLKVDRLEKELASTEQRSGEVTP